MAIGHSTLLTRLARRSCLPNAARLMVRLPFVLGLLLSPTALLAQGNLTVVNPTGTLRIHAFVDDEEAIVETAITGGRIEIQEGPFIDPEKHFILTHVSLGFADVSLGMRALGEHPLPLRQIGMHLREAVGWWGPELQPGVPGAYHVHIPHDAVHITGTPTFVTGFSVDGSYPLPDDDGPLIRIEHRPVAPITGTIDLGARTLAMKVGFRGEVESIFGFGSVRWNILVTLSGPIGPARRTGVLGASSAPTAEPAAAITGR